MKKIVYNHTLTYLFLFITITTFGQKEYSSKAKSTKLTLEGKSIVGYKTSFDFDYSEVRKGWWKYAREFGNPLNMKTYYKVTIPSETTDGNVNLEVFTQTTDSKEGADFFLGLENESYKEQALTLIKDFKKKFYINDLVNQIEENQEKSEKLSEEYRDTPSENRRQELLKQIMQIQKVNESLVDQLVRIERS